MIRSISSKAALRSRLRVERRGAGEQFVEQHAEGDRCRCGYRCRGCSARPAPGDMYTGVPTICAEFRVERLLGQLLTDRLGHAEVDDLGHRLAVVDRDQDVRRLEVAVDDAFLMGMLHGLADRNEQFQPFAASKLVARRNTR